MEVDSFFNLVLFNITNYLSIGIQFINFYPLTIQPWKRSQYSLECEYLKMLRKLQKYILKNKKLRGKNKCNIINISDRLIESNKLEISPLSFNTINKSYMFESKLCVTLSTQKIDNTCHKTCFAKWSTHYINSNRKNI